ncbi:MAG: hypothetical protein JJU02_12720 [Cryomorphaceae bacterium]|nr:hypothetical protein [Cryomorphaceae bacterium]
MHHPENMKSQILVYLLFAFSNLSIAQTISLKIDTSDTKNREYLFFIESFMNDTVVDNPLFWHPKYRDLKVKNINHGFDWIWRTMSPKQINTFYHTQVMELQHINDTLSYFKILISNNDTSSISMYNIYKFESALKSPFLPKSSLSVDF